MDRKLLPDAAFAFIGKIGVSDFRLLRHHNENVKDINDSNTVDDKLLEICLSAINQLPEIIGKDKIEEIKKHLETHAKDRRLIVNEETAKLRINQQDTGETATIENVNRTEESIDEEDIVTTSDVKPTKEVKVGKEKEGSPPIQLDEDVQILKTKAAVWTTKFVNDLPDSSFAVVEKGGTKEGGKTRPGSYRHLPYKDSGGKVDIAHLRNALARMNQIKAASPKDSTSRIRKVARSKLVSAAKKYLPNSQFAKGSDDSWTEEIISKMKVGDIKPLVSGLINELDNIILKDCYLVSDQDGKIGLAQKVNSSVLFMLGDQNMEIEDTEELMLFAKAEKQLGSEDIQVLQGLQVGKPDVMNQDTTESNGANLPVTKPDVTNQNTSEPTGKKPVGNDEEAVQSNPVTDTQGMPIRSSNSLVIEPEMFTADGIDYLTATLNNAINGKIEAKLQSIEKVGSNEFLVLKLGNDEDFPIAMLVEVTKNAEEKVVRVRVPGEIIWGDAIADFSKWLKSLNTL